MTSPCERRRGRAGPLLPLVTLATGPLLFMCEFQFWQEVALLFPFFALHPIHFFLFLNDYPFTPSSKTNPFPCLILLFFPPHPHVLSSSLLLSSFFLAPLFIIPSSPSFQRSPSRVDRLCAHLKGVEGSHHKSHCGRTRAEAGLCARYPIDRSAMGGIREGGTHRGVFVLVPC